MSDIFISYAREDLDAARRLAVVLEGQGWSVFWDRTIPAGKSWREVIGAALVDARCILVLWSKHSVESHWVMEEADYGLKRRVLIPAFTERIEPPFGFGSIQAADLSEWGGDREDAALQRFFGDIAGILGSAPVVTPEEVCQTEAETNRKAQEQQRQQAEAEAKREAKKERQRAQAEEAEAKRNAEERQRQHAEAEAKREAERERHRAQAEEKGQRAAAPRVETESAVPLTTQTRGAERIINRRCADQPTSRHVLSALWLNLRQMSRDLRRLLASDQRRVLDG